MDSSCVDSSCLTGYEPCTLVALNNSSIPSPFHPLLFAFHHFPPLPFFLHYLISYHVLWTSAALTSHPASQWHKLYHLEWGNEGPLLLEECMETCGWERDLPNHCRHWADCLEYQTGQSSWWADVMIFLSFFFLFMDLPFLPLHMDIMSHSCPCDSFWLVLSLTHFVSDAIPLLGSSLMELCLMSPLTHLWMP